MLIEEAMEASGMNQVELIKLYLLVAAPECQL